MKKRNSLIEFYRFFFAMNVVKNHGFFPYQGRLFSPEHISVEFFFMLSGFLLRKSIDKFVNFPYFKGLFLFLKHKVIAMGIPFLIALLMHIPYKAVTGCSPWWDITDWGYMWYVFDMLAIDAFYFTIKKIFKNDWWLFGIAGALCITASIFHAIPEFHDTGWFRAWGAMSLGVLISYIPSIKIKYQALLFIPLVVAWAYIIRILNWDYSFIEEEILNLVCYPILIFVSFQISFNNKVFNYLGALSFGLYAYQTIPRFIRILGYNNEWLFFIIIVFLAVLTDGILRIIRYRKAKKDNINNQTIAA